MILPAKASVFFLAAVTAASLMAQEQPAPDLAPQDPGYHRLGQDSQVDGKASAAAQPVGPTQTIPLPQYPSGSSVRIYIEPEAHGLESYVAAAMVKKHVPAVVTQNPNEARFVLKGVAQPHPESTGGKIARCLFLYCAGMNGFQIASVQLIDQTTQEVAWAYTVNKGASGAYQSTAEAIAKHLKKFLEEHPR